MIEPEIVKQNTKFGEAVPANASFLSILCYSDRYGLRPIEQFCRFVYASIDRNVRFSSVISNTNNMNDKILATQMKTPK